MRTLVSGPWIAELSIAGDGPGFLASLRLYHTLAAGFPYKMMAVSDDFEGWVTWCMGECMAHGRWCNIIWGREKRDQRWTNAQLAMLPVSLTWLAYKKTNIIPEHRCVPVQKITGKFNHYRELCQFLQNLSCLKSKRMETNVSYGQCKDMGQLSF
jgi:hypothetical protein